MTLRKLERRSDHKKMLLRNMVTSLLQEEHVTTTAPKAKEVRRIAEKMITLSKKGELAHRRQALAYLTKEDTVTKLFNDLAVRYHERDGGYTRMVMLGYRKGDGAPLVRLELLK